jgi:hypothetical protein
MNAREQINCQTSIKFPVSVQQALQTVANTIHWLSRINFECSYFARNRPKFNGNLLKKLQWLYEDLKLVARWMRAKIPLKIFKVRVSFTLLSSTRQISGYSERFVYVKDQCVVLSELIQSLSMQTSKISVNEAQEAVVQIQTLLDAMQTFLTEQLSQMVDALNEVKTNPITLATSPVPDPKIDINRFKTLMMQLFSPRTNEVTPVEIKDVNAPAALKRVNRFIQVKEAYVWLMHHDKVVASCVQFPTVRKIYQLFYSTKICSCFMSFYDTMKVTQPAPSNKNNVVAYFYVLLCDSQEDKYVRTLQPNKNAMAFIHSLKHHPLKSNKDYRGAMVLFKCICEFDPNKKDSVGVDNIIKFVDVEPSMSSLITGGIQNFFSHSATKRIKHNMLVSGCK